MTSQRQKTKQTIEVAFLRLLCDAPVEKITVREISDEAQISRNTFYNYFTSVYELKQLVTTDINTNISSRMDRETGLTKAGLAESLTTMIDYLTANQELLRLFFRTPEGNVQLLAIIQNGIKLWRLRAHVRQSDTEANVLIIMSVHGMAGILYHWLYGQLDLDRAQVLSALLSAVRYEP
ncbi:hypothetical protein AYR62_02660 [Secundilactobacillus paracollinoides]|uniref:HTH tetR-type domain-containing protein n=1 Tax=Secundilactobacillus paracollinoides TaxID=240427 RepID=A0A1B2IUM1_9LACO|nr:TetR/AcrR family transcriptional regulator [Secundilactobacillus paracollinoides]ANZ59939.1 hypothetical protein AYR61_00255 [Secundilactobacillus paracollinoides]ANZ63104.1 hypothetical protein AYR62_02660 [Secundilactobacillus paracollinoides]ANZ65730.1 hypothetical protein AYR63_00260 [Secundilactobacillus paracollinoides]